MHFFIYMSSFFISNNFLTLFFPVCTVQLCTSWKQDEKLAQSHCPLKHIICQLLLHNAGLRHFFCSYSKSYWKYSNLLFLFYPLLTIFHPNHLFLTSTFFLSYFNYNPKSPFLSPPFLFFLYSLFIRFYSNKKTASFNPIHIHLTNG